MKHITNFLIEKLIINKNIEIKSLSQKEKDKISEVLCKYFQGKLEYKNIKYKPGLDLLEQKFNNQICNLLDRLGDYPKLYNKVGIKYQEFVDYINEYNDELYKEIKDFVL